MTKPLRLYERLLLIVLAFFVKIWWRTLRIRISADIERFKTATTPHIVVFWHCNIFTIGELHRRIASKRKIVAMVSASRDGEWLAELLRLLDIDSIRGSSNHGAKNVYESARRVLQEGHNVAITPDGPRGPKLRCKNGVIRLSNDECVPIMTLRFRYLRACTLRSWDEFRIPLPFSKITIDVHYFDAEELLSMRTVSERTEMISMMM